jgi:hypothetical protein
MASIPDRTPPVESGPESWSDYFDLYRWELGPESPAGDRLGRAAETLERAAAFLDGLAPPELADLVDAIDGPFWDQVQAAESLPPVSGGAPEPTAADVRDLDEWLAQVDAVPPPDDDFPVMEPAEPTRNRYSVEALANIGRILTAFDRGV